MWDFLWSAGSKPVAPAPEAPPKLAQEQLPTSTDGDGHKSASEKTDPPPQSNSGPDCEQVQIESHTLPPWAGGDSGGTRR